MVNFRIKTEFGTITYSPHFILLASDMFLQLCKNKKFNDYIYDFLKTSNYNKLYCVICQNINYLDIESIQNINIHSLKFLGCCNMYDLSIFQNTNEIMLMTFILYYGLHLLKTKLKKVFFKNYKNIRRQIIKLNKYKLIKNEQSVKTHHIY